MKKYLLLLTTLVGSAFAEEIEITTPKQDSYKTFYVDLDGTLLNEAVGPGISVGYRKGLEEGVAIDISGQAAHVENEGRRNDYFVSIPSVQILKYGGKMSSMNPYFGAGLSYGWYRAGEARFDGIFANVTAGIEFFRKEQLMGGFQVKLSEPALSVKSRGSLYSKPVVSAGLGFGF